jgi:uncharacterized protein (DUF58 family)
MRRSFPAWLRQLFRPRRTIWPTRDGWWCLFVVVALGVAAINTGNNLLYLLVSLLLGLIIVSGVLSEQVMRGVRFTPLTPGEVYAGQPALFGARVTNAKRSLTSYSLTVETVSAAAAPRSHYLARLTAGGERALHWEETFGRRGRHALPGVRLTTRFPFGLFVKTGRPVLTGEVVVYPEVRPLSPDQHRQLEATGHAPARRRGRGTDLHNLRGYRSGDDPRLIHWRSTAKTGTLLVRELLAEATEDTRLVLTDHGSGDAGLLETGLSRAASLATHLVRRGAAVELIGPGVSVPLGRGRAHLDRVLTALALYTPGAARAGGSRREPATRLRRVHVRIG